ncbi:MAG TPA: hypothetical protein VED20_16565 [Streptosporangiaceae bacterium]|nr:hypothetical protein [Streptosporangiaceae bacterium]
MASVPAKTMSTQIRNYGVVQRRAAEDAAGLGFAAPRLSALGLASCAATVAVVVDPITRNSLADSGDTEREGHAVAAE